MRAVVIIAAILLWPLAALAQPVSMHEDRVGDTYSIVLQKCLEVRDGEGCLRYHVREEVISVSDQEVVLRLSLSRLQSVWDDGVQWLDVEPAMHLMMGDTVFPVEVQVVDGVLKEVLNYSTVKASLPSEDREYLDAMCSYDNPPCSQEAPVWRYASFVMRSVPQVGRKQMAGAQVTTRIVGDSSLQRLVRTTSRGRQTGIQGESLTFTTVSEVSVDVAGGYVSKFIWRATVRQKFADGSSTDDKTNGLIATRSLVARGQ